MLKPTEGPAGITNPYISSRLLTSLHPRHKERERERDCVSDPDGVSCMCVRSRLKVARLEWERDKLRVNSNLDCEPRRNGDVVTLRHL